MDIADASDGKQTRPSLEGLGRAQFQPVGSAHAVAHVLATCRLESREKNEGGFIGLQGEVALLNIRTPGPYTARYFPWACGAVLFVAVLRSAHKKREKYTG